MFRRPVFLRFRICGFCVNDDGNYTRNHYLYYGYVFCITTSTITIIIIITTTATTKEFQYSPSSCSDPVCNNDPSLCPNAKVCSPQPLPSFDIIDEFCVIVFTIEYLLRLFTLWAIPCRLASLLPPTWDHDEYEGCLLGDKLAKNVRKPRIDPPELDIRLKYFQYLTSPSNLIDFIAIVPFYISKGNLGGSSSASFVRVLRLVRLLRLLKLTKKNDQMTVLFHTINSSMPVIGILSFYLIVLGIVFGSIMFIIEQGTFKVTESYSQGAYFRPTLDGESEVVTTFESISVGMYWAFVTCTTLGYGDVVGTTVFGRLVTCICAVFGIVILALPISVVGSTFTDEYFQLMERKRVKAKLSKEQELKGHQTPPINASPSISCIETDVDIEKPDNVEVDRSQFFYQKKIEQIEQENLHPLFLVEKLQDLMTDLEADEKYICDQLDHMCTSAHDVTHALKEIKASSVARLQLLKSCITDPDHKPIDPNILLGTSDENLYQLIINLEN